MQSKIPIIAFSLFITLLLNQLLGTPFLATMSVGLFVFSFHLFVERLGTTIPFRELAFLVTVIQLLLSSYLAFYIQPPDPIFTPKGDPADYFNYAIPGVLFFTVGLFTFKSNIKFQAKLRDHLTKLDLFVLGKIFIQAGFIALFTSYIAPKSIQYFIVLVSFLTYIGGFIILFSDVPKTTKAGWILLSFFPVINSALYDGIFFMALIWLVYLFLYYMLLVPYSFKQKLVWVTLGLYIVIAVDTAKSDFRKINDKTYQESLGNRAEYNAYTRVAIFSQLLWEKMTFQTLFSNNNLSGRVTRANQGALVTWVMAHTPYKEPYGEGETIYESVKAAIFPRFILPNKAQAGGRVNFEKYTGFKLNSSTSMNISLLGEGWANFGYTGGLLFMYLIGAFYSLIFYIFSKAINKYPVYYFFIPFIFIYTIKAEDDLLTPLNHIVKATFVLYVLHEIFIKRTIRKVSN